MMINNNEPGEVKKSDTGVDIKFVRFLKHSPERIWKAITTPAEFNTWYSGELTIDGRVGGLLTVQSGPFFWSGPILEWEPNRKLVYEHNCDASDLLPTGARTTVSWELDTFDEGTILTFTHKRLPGTEGFAAGTHAVLDRLIAEVDGQTLPTFDEGYAAVEPLYPVWTAPDYKPEK
jgi:uncharacterized protein YndB with AHSA1/START domain